MFRWEPRKTRSNYRVFSGTDLIPVAYTAGQLVILGNLQTISHSVHSELHPVRSFSHRDVKAYVPGQRTYAGTMIFVEFDYGALAEISGRWQQDYLWGSQMRALQLSSLPPFDVIVTYQNEYGSLAYLRIFGITIPDEGNTSGINQLAGETVVQYTALGIDRLTPVYEKGSTAVFNDTIYYGRYDLNNLRTEGGGYVSELLGQIRRLQTAKSVILNQMQGQSQTVYNKGYNSLVEIENRIAQLQDMASHIDEYDEINISQALQSSPYLSRVIDTGIEVYHEQGLLIDYTVDNPPPKSNKDTISGINTDETNIINPDGTQIAGGPPKEFVPEFIPEEPDATAVAQKDVRELPNWVQGPSEEFNSSGEPWNGTLPDSSGESGSPNNSDTIKGYISELNELKNKPIVKTVLGHVVPGYWVLDKIDYTDRSILKKYADIGSNIILTAMYGGNLPMTYVTKKTLATIAENVKKIKQYLQNH